MGTNIGPCIDYANVADFINLFAGTYGSVFLFVNFDATLAGILLAFTYIVL